MSKDSREQLVHDIDVELARIPLVIELADLAIENANRTEDTIRSSLARYETDRAESIATLKRAGLLKD
jgi:hypothetical protein